MLAFGHDNSHHYRQVVPCDAKGSATPVAGGDDASNSDAHTGLADDDVHEPNEKPAPPAVTFEAPFTDTNPATLLPRVPTVDVSPPGPLDDAQIEEQLEPLLVKVLSSVMTRVHF